LRNTFDLRRTGFGPGRKQKKKGGGVGQDVALTIEAWGEKAGDRPRRGKRGEGKREGDAVFYNNPFIFLRQSGKLSRSKRKEKRKTWSAVDAGQFPPS